MTETTTTAIASADPRDPRYRQLLAQLDEDLVELYTVVLAARGVPEPAGVLVDVHHRLRGLAATVNTALGGWPEPDPGGDPP